MTARIPTGWTCEDCGHESADEDEPCSCDDDTSDLIAEVRRLRADVKKAREFIAASEACASSIRIVEISDHNARMRQAMTEVVSKITAGQPNVQIHMGGCEWCPERWIHPDGATEQDVQQNAIRHARQCPTNPMRLELEALRAALVEAAELVAGTCQCESQYADYTKDPDHVRAMAWLELAKTRNVNP